MPSLVFHSPREANPANSDFFPSRRASGAPETADTIEEADAWKAYLETYHRSLFRLQIEDRIEALDEASFDEVIGEQERASGPSSEDGRPGAGAGSIDAK